MTNDALLSDENQIGRLAFRREGSMVNAYWAHKETMDGATLLGSIAAAVCDAQEGMFDRFKALMREAMGETVFQATGVRPLWGGEERAPEHERSGRG